MLQKLREKTSGWIATAIIGLLMIPFLFVIDSSYLGGVGANNVAKVQAPPSWWSSAPSWWPVSFLWRHHEVSTEQFRLRFEEARQQAREQQGENFDPREFESADNKRKVLDQLIDEQVVKLAAEQAHVVVGDAAVRDYIATIPAFQKDGKFDPERYRLALASGTPPRTPAMFDQLVRDGLQQSLIPSALMESAFATKQETERLLKMLGETRDVDLALLPEPPADTAPVSDAQVQQWYDAHQADFKQPERVSIEYVELDASKLPPAKPADEAALRKRYEDEKARFVEPDQRLASHILISAGKDPASQKAAEAKAAKLAAEAKQPGADFAALARANSEDPGSKNAGGDLGWVEKGVMVKPFEDALFAMKAGDIVGPVKSEFGYHVIQLREIKGGKGKRFEQVRDQLAGEQQQADNEKVYSDLSGRLVDLVLKSPTALAPAAKQVGLPVQTLGPFSRADASGIAAQPTVRRAAFSDALVQDGTVSDPITLGPNHTVLIRVTQHLPEQTQPLAKVREQVAAAVHADRTAKAAAAKADALLERLRKGETLQALAGPEKLQINPMPGLPRTVPMPSPEANRAIFSAPLPAPGKPSVGKVELSASGVPGGAKRYALFVLNKVNPGDLSKVPAEQQATLKQQLGQIEGAAAAKSYIDAMRKRYKVSVQEAQL
ncbi:peptidylprolyl isomerase [Xanthomonas translucens pv. undulosa]|uniref:peptidylprolyl isomerase n=1 Tax=Xanthomonas campestris pv. translucens TaxID=343 RepID=UPI000641EB7B|nr:peptidylprolyl isomerase [Xanthomonas translucens]AKK66753.1 peptidylprolyl isomerase [Xanthomonas translucens pv. undulosa]MCT8270780.1 peptidylprolyl isomerase [Xanthomonas translucens pv. undulosa]QSQ41355.1 peptidylprolyl isomerase [Xanthomonas translucens pv. translucens]QSQ50773.1 peptidylprolyl isomerase [Xanthomonas translucens pv. undulosa]WLA01808.1 peptidylprolyl isomerase [Xanthomonas translucens]